MPNKAGDRYDVSFTLNVNRVGGDPKDSMSKTIQEWKNQDYQAMHMTQILGSYAIVKAFAEAGVAFAELRGLVDAKGIEEMKAAVETILGGGGGNFIPSPEPKKPGRS